MAGIEEGKKRGRPCAKGVELFKGGKYKEAINEFTNFLESMPDNGNKKVALYNRGMSYYNLGQHDMALGDGESCLKIDPTWVKGYKCKGLALEGLGKYRDAIDTFLTGQKMCSSLHENTDEILNPLIERLNLKITEDKIQNREEKKGEKTGLAKGVELYKEGKYKEAIIQFTTYLKAKPYCEKTKLAHYNRGMAHYNLGQHESALKDGEECVKIGPFWAKGYKCKGLALEGMGRPRDAVGTFLDGQKMCIGQDQNTEAVLGELIKRLNRETGFLGEDLDQWDRMRKEKYCVTCNLFEKDMDPKLGDGKKFISCDRCKMVNYCCRQHRQEDRVTHNEVCQELQSIRKNSEDFDIVQIVLKEVVLAVLVLKPKGPKGLQMVNMMKGFDLPPIFKNIMDCLRGVEDGNLMPLYLLPKFNPVTETQQKELNTWNDLFTMLERRTNIPEMATDLTKLHATELGAVLEQLDRDIKRALTDVLTDPMTVFYAMKQLTLLDSSDGDKVIRLHVVGAEASVEIPKTEGFFNVLSNITVCKLHIVYIGPLLTSPPGEVQIDNPTITLFQGTYQDYILTSDYEKPDCIVAFYPGLHDGTYNWLPAIAQAIAKKVPFLVTCDGKEDYQKTKEWLMKGTCMKPEIVLDYLNPFGSWEAVQNVSGSNSVSERNMFALLFMGGDLGALRPLLRVEEEKVERVQVLFRFLEKNSLSDIMKLKKSGKM